MLCAQGLELRSLRPLVQGGDEDRKEEIEARFIAWVRHSLAARRANVFRLRLWLDASHLFGLLLVFVCGINGTGEHRDRAIEIRNRVRLDEPGLLLVEISRFVAIARYSLKSSGHSAASICPGWYSLRSLSTVSETSSRNIATSRSMSTIYASSRGTRRTNNCMWAGKRGSKLTQSHQLRPVTAICHCTWLRYFPLSS